jgi:ubiquinone/menaquinone biosynthesis C-methylase UbiE
MPVAEDLHLAYQTYFTHAESPELSNSSAGLRDALYICYQAANFLPALVIGLNRARTAIASMFLDLIQPGKLVDVGCGDGAFLSHMRDLGWSVEGVDFDEKAIRNAKSKYGLALIHGDLRSAHFPENTFDAITMKHVIEHVPDPVALLEEARRILKPKGRLVVTTPNAGGYGHKKFRQYWYGLDQPRHLHVFSLAALRNCARRAGLDILEVFSSAANADTFVGGSYSIRDSIDHQTTHFPPPNLGRTIKSIVAQYRQQLSLRANFELGEEAVIIATKNGS